MAEETMAVKLPAEEGLSDPGSFPLVGYAAIAVTAHLLFVLATPPNPVRSALGLLCSVAAGYCALSLIVRTARLSRSEILAFSVGLGILLTGGSAVLLAASRLPVGDFAALVFGIPLAIAAALVNRGGRISIVSAVPGLLRAFAFPEYSPRERWLARALYAAVVAALLVLVAVATVQYPDRLSPALTLGGTDGSPDTLPSSLARNQSQEFVFGVLGGSSGGSFEVRVRLAPQNATGSEAYHPIPWASLLLLDPLAESAVNVSVASRGTWSERVALSLDASGPWEIRLDLMDGTEVIASVHLPVVVTG